MRTSNPAMRAFNKQTATFGDESAMSVYGAINKTALCFIALFFTASLVWNQTFSTGIVPPWAWVGAFGGFIVAIATVFKPQWSPITAPIYAALEGLFIGAISAVFEKQYPGLVLQAVTLTFLTLGTMLVLYRTGIIRATEKFKAGIFAATGAICLLYFVNIIMSLFGSGIPFIHSNGVFGIGFSMIVCGIAALNLILDFDLIERGAANGLPKYMEWYSAFALMVTLVWLYLEILRLLAKLQSRR